MPAEDLPAPTVSAERYTEDYYRHVCIGARDWEASGGGELGTYQGYAAHVGVRPGEVLVDLGCGRGELLVAALQAGAAQAIGVEYAEAAVRLAAQTVAVHGVADRAVVHHADARSVPVDSGVADVVCLMDVVEHLTSHELQRTLAEARRILRPGGRLWIHTFPNALVYDVTYRVHRALRVGRRQGWPADPRHPDERRMHVNEMTLGRLRRALVRGGFREPHVALGLIVHEGFVPDPRARVLYHRLASHRVTWRFGRGDLWAHAVR